MISDTLDVKGQRNLALPTPRGVSALQTHVLELIFFIFILFVLTNGHPLPSAYISQTLNAASSAIDEGDTSRKLFYTSALLLSFAFSFQHFNITLFKKYPLPLLVLSLYGILSAVWAIDPGFSIRRSLLSTLVLLCCCNFIAPLGVERSLKIFGASLSFCMVTSLLAVFVVPQWAIHQSTEAVSIDPALIGSWKGIFGHKNIASSVAALAVIWAVHNPSKRSKWIAFAEIAIAIIFLLGTRGKTSMVLLFPTLIIGLFSRYFLTSFKGKLFFCFLNASAVILVFCVAVVFEDKIEAVIHDPHGLTSRIAVWRMCLEYASEHPWLGAGFSSFWGIGIKSPVYIYAKGSLAWLTNIYHSHNGFIEILITLGIPGLILGIFAIVVVPYISFLKTDPAYNRFNGMFVSMWLFCVGYNITETNILARDKQVWVALMIVIISQRLLLLTPKTKPPKTRNSPETWEK